MSIWAQFVLCAAVIGIAGSLLSRCGDAIATHTGLSRTWIGLILIATVTSLPELATGLSAVVATDAPDIAAGDVLGSCVLNLALLALIDACHRGAIYASASVNHAVSAMLGIVLLSIVAAAVLLAGRGELPRVGHVSAASLLIVGIYLGGMRVLYVVEQRRADSSARARCSMTLKRALAGYGASASLIVGMGIWLPFIGLDLAKAMGWSDSLVGTLFVALATSLPELATTWGAMRIGAVDMAFGNLLGSNLFDVLILALDDMAYLRGPIYDDLSPVHGFSALIACAMSAAVALAFYYRPLVRVWRFGSLTSFALLALYGINAMVQYSYGR